MTRGPTLRSTITGAAITAQAGRELAEHSGTHPVRVGAGA